MGFNEASDLPCSTLIMLIEKLPQRLVEIKMAVGEGVSFGQADKKGKRKIMKEWRSILDTKVEKPSINPLAAIGIKMEVRNGKSR